MDHKVIAFGFLLPGIKLNLISITSMGGLDTSSLHVCIILYSQSIYLIKEIIFFVVTFFLFCFQVTMKHTNQLLMTT
jgi:hypothetical protein